MLKKTKIWMTAFAVMLAMLVSFVPVHAAELSEETVEVPEDGEKHTVAAFGNSIALVYPDGKTEIIANNLSGRIDVMLDGEVIKGIGLVSIPAQNRTDMILEMGSCLVGSISEQQADSLKRTVADGLKNDTPVSALSVIENRDGMNGVNAFLVGDQGELQNADGSAAPADALSGMQVKTPEAAYQEFVEEMEENIRKDEEAAREERERENEESFSSDGAEDDTGKTDDGEEGSGTTGACRHNWELDESVNVLILNNGASCATPPFYRCTLCKRLMWMNYNVHVHNEEERCEYCGYGGDSCADGSHNYVEMQIGTETVDPIVMDDKSRCFTGTVERCTKCHRVLLRKANQNIHRDDFCEYCGYNKAGEKKE